MKYNLTFYKDWLGTLYFIIVSSDDRQYCSFYVDSSANTNTSLLEILKLNLNKTYSQHSIEKHIVKYSIGKQDEYISSYLELTLNEVCSIIFLYADICED